jgi:hypothetical protein
MISDLGNGEKKRKEKKEKRKYLGKSVTTSIEIYFISQPISVNYVLWTRVWFTSDDPPYIDSFFILHHCCDTCL